MKHKEKRSLAFKIGGKLRFMSDEWRKRKNSIQEEVLKREYNQKEASRLRKEKLSNQ